MQSKVPPESSLKSQTAAAPAATAVAVETQSGSGEGACGACHSPLPTGARFCPECGASAAGDICPACSANVEGQDFCQGCGHWLRPGDCRFCYETVPEGAAFCPSCGCDQSGIECAGCGTRNFFDFCTTCGAALSEAAALVAAEIDSDPDISAALQRLSMAVSAPLESAPEPGIAPSMPARRGLFSAAHREAMRGLSAGLVKNAGSPAPGLATVDPPAAAKSRGTPVREAPSVGAAAGPAGQRASDADMRAEIERDRERERQKTSNVKLLVDRAAVDELLAAAARKSFSNQQEARRFHMALATRLQQVSRNPNGWLCNRYSYLHLDGPNGCSAPQFGGVWVF